MQLRTCSLFRGQRNWARSCSVKCVLVHLGVYSCFASPQVPVSALPARNSLATHASPCGSTMAASTSASILFAGARPGRSVNNNAKTLGSDPCSQLARSPVSFPRPNQRLGDDGGAGDMLPALAGTAAAPAPAPAPLPRAAAFCMVLRGRDFISIPGLPVSATGADAAPRRLDVRRVASAGSSSPLDGRFLLRAAAARIDALACDRRKVPDMAVLQHSTGVGTVLVNQGVSQDLDACECSEQGPGGDSCSVPFYQSMFASATTRTWSHLTWTQVMSTHRRSGCPTDPCGAQSEQPAHRYRQFLPPQGSL